MGSCAWLAWPALRDLPDAPPGTLAGSMSAVGRGTACGPIARHADATVSGIAMGATAHGSGHRACGCMGPRTGCLVVNSMHALRCNMGLVHAHHQRSRASTAPCSEMPAAAGLASLM